MQDASPVERGRLSPRSHDIVVHRPGSERRLVSEVNLSRPSELSGVEVGDVGERTTVQHRSSNGSGPDAPGRGNGHTPPASGRRHGRERTITRPGLDDRGGVFFAAVEMTRMPMILTDPSLDDNPIVFANKAFLDLTGYEESEVLGRNCRFLQGARSDREMVAEMREAIERRDSVSVELINYKRDGTAFWNAVFIGPVYDTTGELLYFFASQLVERTQDVVATSRLLGHRQVQTTMVYVASSPERLAEVMGSLDV